MKRRHIIRYGAATGIILLAGVLLYNPSPIVEYFTADPPDNADWDGWDMSPHYEVMVTMVGVLAGGSGLVLLSSAPRRHARLSILGIAVASVLVIGLNVIVESSSSYGQRSTVMASFLAMIFAIAAASVVPDGRTAVLAVGVFGLGLLFGIMGGHSIVRLVMELFLIAEATMIMAIGATGLGIIVGLLLGTSPSRSDSAVSAKRNA